jgi:hypothetical protein
MGKSVLIVSFSFPPSPSIGGRRWSYMAESLSKLNNEIHVITSDFDDSNKGECPWNKCISNFQNNITYIPHKTPFHVLNKSPEKIIDKIKYKISEKKALTKKDTNPYDRSIYFSEQALELALEKIKKLNIKNVILTGGPYDFLFKLSNLKIIFGDNLNLIVDYRDPWTEFYSIKKLKEPISIIERNQHNRINKIADCIYTPYDFIRNKYNELWKNLNIKVLPHGFDNVLFDEEILINKQFNKWCYAGTLYPELGRYINILYDLIDFANVKLSIYTYSDYQSYEKLNNKSVTFNNLVSQKNLLKLTSNVGIFIYFFNTDHIKPLKTSKFFELIRRGVFILYFGPEGEVSTFIEENNLGYCIYNKEENNDIGFHAVNIDKLYKSFIPKPNLVDDFSFKIVSEKIFNDLV